MKSLLATVGITLFALPLTALTELAPQMETTAQVEITEWTVPWEHSRPRDPWVGAPDSIWFVGQRTHYVATLNPQTGEFQRFDLEPGTGPHTVISDQRGAWYAGNRADHIGLIDPDSGDIEKIVLPGDGPRDPHTMDFTSDGNIWFSVQHGNQIGYLDTESREITLYDLPTANARPYGLIVDQNDKPWTTLFGTNKLASIGNGKVEEIPLPRSESRPRRLAVTADGMVWYVDYAGGYLGRYNPDSGAVDEWPAPSGERSRPYAMTSDKEGRLWFVETGVQPNRFIGFDPDSASFTAATEIDSGGGTVRHMVYDRESNSIWFGTDTNTIGRARLP